MRSNRNSTWSEKKIGNSGGEEGLTILEFREQGGVEYFGFSEGKGRGGAGLKCSCHLW